MTDTVSKKLQIVCIFMFLMVGTLFLEYEAYFRNTMRLNVNIKIIKCSMLFISLSRPEKILIKFWRPPKMWLIYVKKK